MPRRDAANSQEQIGHAYRRMARFYRPAAPSDGLGNIAVPARELDLDAECGSYAEAWLAEEDKLAFHIGCPDFGDRTALIYVVEAARNICGMAPGAARKLLELALLELDGKKGLPKDF